MEALTQNSDYILSPNWVSTEKKSGKWSREENKMFENALACLDLSKPDRWERVAELLPGKSVSDVISHYKDLEEDVNHIEAGLIPLPGYSSSSFSFGFDEIKQSYNSAHRKRGRLYDQERKKGVPWTEEEHRQFLMGLKKHGKGDWRNISRNFVLTRTPTQVASHAQKYFNRLNSVGKDKKRASIHDITIADLLEDSSLSSGTTKVADSNQIKEDNEGYNKGYMQLRNDSAYPFGITLEHQNSYRGGFHDAMLEIR